MRKNRDLRAVQDFKERINELLEANSLNLMNRNQCIGTINRFLKNAQYQNMTVLKFLFYSTDKSKTTQVVNEFVKIYGA